MISTISNRRQFTKIVLVGLLPCLNALIWLSLFSNGWAAMYSMHLICMLIIPTFVYGLNYITSNTRDAMEYMKSFDIVKCIYIALSTSAIGTISLYLLLELQKVSPILNLLNAGEIRKGLLKEGIIKDSVHGLGLFVWFSRVYFSLVNPIVEELFWRSFVYKELIVSLGVGSEASLQSRCTFGEIGDNYTDSFLEREHKSCLIEKHIDVESGQKNYKATTELMSIICSVLYSSYHFFVLIHFSSLYFSALSTIFLAIAGRILLYVSRKFHIVCSVYIHIGMDISVILFSLLIE